jgi:hypothetical protein
MRTQLAILLAAVSVSTVGQAAHADPGEIRGEAGSDAYAIIGEKANDAAIGSTDFSPATHAVDAAPVYAEYRWVVVCTRPNASQEVAIAMDCQAARVCAQSNERLYRLWGRTENPPAWLPLSTRCFGQPPTAADTPQPRITPALVLNEIRRIGLPILTAKTQPEGKTLVNFDTIFYTEAQPFNATVTLLGQQVDVVAEATEYAWHHGDGSTTTTSTPGAPYPSKEITYRYADADTTVRPRVDVTYSARFRVNGGAWQDIDETVTITGPQGSLRVSEARGVLSGNYG